MCSLLKLLEQIKELLWFTSLNKHLGHEMHSKWGMFHFFLNRRGVVQCPPTRKHTNTFTFFHNQNVITATGSWTQGLTLNSRTEQPECSTHISHFRHSTKHLGIFHCSGKCGQLPMVSISCESSSVCTSRNYRAFFTSIMIKWTDRHFHWQWNTLAKGEIANPTLKITKEIFPHNK